MHSSFYFNFRYLRTPMGVVKLLNVVLGAISLILVCASYVSIWTLAVFIGTVTSCLLLSLFYIVFYLLTGPAVTQSKINKFVSFLYHVLAGTALIVAGIELIGWSEYKAVSCEHDCPHLYSVGVAKTLTFMNGTLYLIVAFLGIKDDDMLDPESADADIPLMSSTISLAKFPGSISGSKQALHNGHNQHQFLHHSYHYDNYFRHMKAPSDLASTSSYRNQCTRPPPQYISAEYSFNNSYNSTSTYNDVQFGGGGGAGVPTINGNNGRRSTRNFSSSVPNTAHAPSLPPGVDLHQIKE